MLPTENKAMDLAYFEA